jgi:hypothetical protein
MKSRKTIEKLVMATKPIPPKPRGTRREAVEQLTERLSSTLERRLEKASPVERAEATRKLRALASRSHGASGKR